MTIDQLIQDSAGTTGATVQQTAVISKSLSDRLTNCANAIGVRKSQIQACAISEACTKIEASVIKAQAIADAVKPAPAEGKATKNKAKATATTSAE